MKVDFTNETVCVQAKLPTSNYELNLNLSHEINPERSSFKVMTTKIEIKLCKVSAGKWSVLEKKSDEASEKEKPPTYPTSSLAKHDWNKLEKELEKEADKDADSDVNGLFRKIFRDGDANLQRAMMKSFQESNGTVLSTNWDDVKKKTVEVKPPEGVEYKRFTP